MVLFDEFIWGVIVDMIKFFVDVDDFVVVVGDWN